MWKRTEKDASLSLVATALLVVTAEVLYFSHSLFGANPATIALQIAAALLMTWARLIMRGRSFHASATPTEGGLVMRGPYRLIRHPIYSATLLFLWAGVGSHASVKSVVLALFASMVVVVRIVTEERLLKQHFPEYAHYTEYTKRLVPFVI